jgi:hypothetical protein
VFALFVYIPCDYIGMSQFDSIYTAYVAAVFILFGCYATQVVEVSELTVFAIIQSAVLWTIIRLLYLFMFSWDTTHLFAAIFLVATFGGVIFYFMPPFIRDILGNFLVDKMRKGSGAGTKGIDIESILKEGLPEE